MITIRFFNTVVTISSVQEEDSKEIIYNSWHRWLVDVDNFVGKMYNEALAKSIATHQYYCSYELDNAACISRLLKEKFERMKHWYTNDIDKMKLIDIIKTKIEI